SREDRRSSLRTAGDFHRSRCIAFVAAEVEPVLPAAVAAETAQPDRVVLSAREDIEPRIAHIGARVLERHCARAAHAVEDLLLTLLKTPRLVIPLGQLRAVPN